MPGVAANIGDCEEAEPKRDGGPKPSSRGGEAPAAPGCAVGDSDTGASSVKLELPAEGCGVAA